MKSIKKSFWPFWCKMPFLRKKLIRIQNPSLNKLKFFCLQYFSRNKFINSFGGVFFGLYFVILISIYLKNKPARSCAQDNNTHIRNWALFKIVEFGTCFGNNVTPCSFSQRSSSSFPVASNLVHTSIISRSEA